MKKNITILLILMGLLFTYGCDTNNESIEANSEEVENTEDNENTNIDEEDINTNDSNKETDSPDLSENSVDTNAANEEIKSENDGSKEDTFAIEEPLTIIEETLNNNYVENDIKYYEVNVTYPKIIFDGENETLSQMNQDFKDNANAVLEENTTYALDTVENIKQAINSGSYDEESYSNFSTYYDVTYNNYGYLSIIEKTEEYYFGTAEPKNSTIATVYDVNTGSGVGIEEILEGTPTEISEFLGDIFMTSDLISDEIKTEYEEDIRENTQYAGFYLEEDAMVVYYDPYTVAPYAAGTLSARIPFSSKDYFKESFYEIINKQ